MSAPPIAMSGLVWDCHGLGNPCTENKLANLVQAKDLSVVFLAKTWADEARQKNMLRKIRCENIFIAPRSNKGGGLVLFWRSTIDITVEVLGTNYIEALFQEEDRARIGMIIRDCQGRAWHKVEIIPLLLIVMELETLATSKALQFAADLSLNDIIPEGDSKIVINALNANSYSLASFGLLSQDVKCFANLFHCIRFSHVCREGNSVAHNLVRHARHVTGFQVWMEDVPLHTITTYQAVLPTI